ncbi:MAG: hypothetical protein NZ578_12275 [Candidatus Binatia bacterium]|nr:hypothetical protein [Candidatus Binatia bacterium]
MAQLTAQEFADLVTILANHFRLERLHERLLKANAIVSRKRPPTSQALASQLYQLSLGLRRAHPARYAIETLWQEMLSQRIGEERNQTLETLADRVNGCLTNRMEVIPEKCQELLAALGAYYQAIAAYTGDDIAYLEMLLRASTDVARFLREHRAAIVAVGSPPAAVAESISPDAAQGQAAPEDEKHEA